MSGMPLYRKLSHSFINVTAVYPLIISIVDVNENNEYLCASLCFSLKTNTVLRKTLYGVINVTQVYIKNKKLMSPR